MPITKKLSKKAASRSNKCPWCGSRSFKDAEKLNLFEKIRFIGCKAWVCLKCNKKWAG
jgi:DNA-directed RNA polymerase subunit RPC12/RpoP